MATGARRVELRNGRQALARYLAAYQLPQARCASRGLCGDLNAPQHERESGEIITWGYNKRHGDYILKDSRQHELELRMLRELSTYDLHDVYRRLHGYGEQTREEVWSWCYRDQFKYRFDHVFASATLCPMQAQYLHSFRELRLSDHRPLEAVFAPRCI